jgi:hypothetical protein
VVGVIEVQSVGASAEFLTTAQATIPKLSFALYLKVFQLLGTKLSIVGVL